MGRRERRREIRELFLPSIGQGPPSNGLQRGDRVLVEIAVGYLRAGLPLPPEEALKRVISLGIIRDAEADKLLSARRDA